MIFKREFLEYVLFEYKDMNKHTVWALNFIKSNPNIYKNITFIDTSAPIKVYINERSSTLMLSIDEFVYLHPKDILYKLNEYEGNKIYVHFRFKNENKKYEQVKLKELYKLYNIKIHDKSDLKYRIDESLTNKDKDVFILLTNILKNIE